MTQKIFLLIFAIWLQIFSLTNKVFAQSCAEFFGSSKELVARDSALTPADQEILRMTSSETGFFDFKERGLHFIVELARGLGSGYDDRLKLVSFKLDYDPRQFMPGSYFRRILGSKAMHYSEVDLRLFTQNRIYSSQGQVLEFYLRLPNDPNKEIEEGPLLAISLKTGAVIGYPAGTNVDAAGEGVLRGSFAAVLSFAQGLSIELQAAMRGRRRGGWFAHQINSEVFLLDQNSVKKIGKE